MLLPIVVIRLQGWAGILTLNQVAIRGWDMARFSKDALENAPVLSESHVAGKSLMTPDDLAKILSVNRQTIFRWVREGKLGCVKLSLKKPRFTEEQLAEFIQTRIAPFQKPIDRVKNPGITFPPHIPTVIKQNTDDSATAIRKELLSWR